MTLDLATPQHVRHARGSALRSARKAAGLSAEVLALHVNDRTHGSDITRHAIYSYEQGKVLLSREVGHRIAQALNLHPGQLLLGDPDYRPPGSSNTAPGSSNANLGSSNTAPGSSNANPGNPHAAAGTSNANLGSSNTAAGSLSAAMGSFEMGQAGLESGGYLAGSPLAASPDTAVAPGIAVELRVELVRHAQGTLPAAEVLVRLLRSARLGQVNIAGYLDVFHLLLGDTLPLTTSPALLAAQGFGDHAGNEAPFALAAAVVELHTLVETMLKKLIAPEADNANTLFAFCQDHTQQLAALLQTLHGQIRACNKHLPGISVND